MIPGYQVLATRIRAELEGLDRGVRGAERAWQAAQRAGAEQDMFIDSAALNLTVFMPGWSGSLRQSPCSWTAACPKARRGIAIYWIK